jgi:molybdenum cofactor cytidylyltransferase
LMANVPVTKTDIVGMGVGGLLMEIPTRPQPRDPRPPVTRANVAIAVLAAGQSTRMNGTNKLLATFDNVPLLRRSALLAIEADGHPVIAVLGHMAEQCSAVLDGLNVVIALNKDYASGLASSLQTAIRHVPSSADGVMMLLADMPALSASDLKSMITRFQHAGGQSVVRATYEGKRGNPVLLPRLLFDEVFSLAGDVGARHLIERGDIPVIDVELGEAAAIDVDTPDMLNRAGGTITETTR